jgi:hypothetical protein
MTAKISGNPLTTPKVETSERIAAETLSQRKFRYYISCDSMSKIEDALREAIGPLVGAGITSGSFDGTALTIQWSVVG